VQLKDESNLMAKKVERHTPVSGVLSVHQNAATIRFIQSAQQVKQRALAAAGWAAERHRFPRGHIEADPIQHRNRPLVIALPNFIDAG
jgi:hypothetical protein